jgi:hypothetical protein
MTKRTSRPDSTSRNDDHFVTYTTDKMGWTKVRCGCGARHTFTSKERADQWTDAHIEAVLNQW